jgi:SOS response regulatory protein OraA/RecX
MAKLKTYLMEQHMTEAEIEEYLDYLYAEHLMKQDAYRYEDNHNPNTMEKARLNKKSSGDSRASGDKNE